MRHSRNIRIIATLGPASCTPAQIRDLHEAGADVFRLNMSHGSHEDITALHKAVRQVEHEARRPIGILVDLQGPKFRIGAFEGKGVDLVPGQKFRLDMVEKPGDSTRVCLPHREVFSSLHRGHRLLLNDGNIRLRITEAGADFAESEVEIGGHLSARKGVNVPEAMVDTPPLTPKDHKDLAFALSLGVDWVALSFVQRVSDVVEAYDLIGGRAGLIAKIEKPSALKEIEGIVALADGVMVARGDLGVEMPVEDVPGAQKAIIDAARNNGKVVVVATQMLESMVHNPVPTRAEVSDVANAVFEGADAVMLSAESAVGDHPVEAVRMMDRVGRKIERDPYYRSYLESVRTPPEATSADAITTAARQVVETMGASTIVTYTTSGSTALRAARERPSVPIMVLTPSIDTARRLTLYWGLNCVTSPDARNFADMVGKARRIAKAEGFAQTDDHIVVTAGHPFGTPGRTNVLRIARVHESD